MLSKGVFEQFISVLTHEEMGNTQTGKIHYIQSELEHSIKYLRLQPFAKIIAIGCLINRRVTRNANKQALNEHSAETSKMVLAARGCTNND